MPPDDHQFRFEPPPGTYLHGEYEESSPIMIPDSPRRKKGKSKPIPIVEDDKLIGIISMGDIVKNRLDELEDETQQMRDYIATS